MPSYFYHISLEILSDTSSHLEQFREPQEASSQVLLFLKSAREALHPFQKRRQKSGRGARSGLGEGAQGKFGHLVLGSSESDNLNTSMGVVIGNHPEVQCLPTTTSSPSSQPYRHQQPDLPLTISAARYLEPATLQYPVNSTSGLANDRRLDRLSLECIDMVLPEAANRQHDHKNDGDDDSHGNQITKGIGTNIFGGLATKGKYVPLDQKTSESVWGIVHLYRDADITASLYDDDLSYLKGSPTAQNPRTQTGAANLPYQSGHVAVKGASMPVPSSEDCTTLCILAVPSYLSPSDFLGFVGEATRDEVRHFRMIKTARANRYMVLMKFRSGRKAREWQRDWNGKVFNSMEPETCHVVFVKTVEIQVGASGTESRFPNMNNDPFTSSAATTPNPVRVQPSAQTSATPVTSSQLSAKPLAPPTPSLIELPTCPVCLERMDETTGLLTIICQHVFHCTCLQKWKGTGCPVCRYTQDDFGKRTHSSDCPDGPRECSVCHSGLNLWLCLICGNIGCGRYDGAHAFAHYKQTSHSFAMDLATQRVWDYVGDSYVHRIIQNKSDGKLVELPAAGNSALEPPDWADAVPREKLENMGVEYTHLLTSQLESQRTYFEEKMERAADKASEASATAAAAREAAELASARLAVLQAQYDSLIHETIPNLERDKGRAQRRAERFESMAHKIEKEWREEKAMTGSLMERVEFLNAEVERLKLANDDLTEQNRDLTFFISGSEKLKGQGEDVVEGTVSVPEAANSAKRKKGKSKSK